MCLCFHKGSIISKSSFGEMVNPSSVWCFLNRSLKIDFSESSEHADLLALNLTNNCISWHQWFCSWLLSKPADEREEKSQIFFGLQRLSAQLQGTPNENLTTKSENGSSWEIPFEKRSMIFGIPSSIFRRFLTGGSNDTYENLWSISMKLPWADWVASKYMSSRLVPTLREEMRPRWFQVQSRFEVKLSFRNTIFQWSWIMVYSLSFSHCFEVKNLSVFNDARIFVCFLYPYNVLPIWVLYFLNITHFMWSILKHDIMTCQPTPLINPWFPLIRPY